MIKIKKVEVTPVDRNYASVIDSFDTLDDKTKNAPSIRATEARFGSKLTLDVTQDGAITRYVYDGSRDVNISIDASKNIAVLTGTIMLEPHDTTLISMDFPAGFNKDNSVVISAGIDIYEQGVYMFGAPMSSSGEAIAFYVSYGDPSSTSGDRTKIYMRVSLTQESEVDIPINAPYKIVLMKIA